MKNLTSLKHEWSLVFYPQFLLNDIFAGFCVAILAIPLSLAVAMAANVPPQIALISAIIGGIVAAIFGGNRFSITGPAIAMSILIAECISNNGIMGLFVIGITCGILQLALGTLRLSHIVRIIPVPVISAFIAAIGFFIFFEQIAILMNISIYNSPLSILQHLDSSIFSSNTFLLAVITAIILLIGNKIFAKSPVFILAIIIPTLYAHFSHLANINFISLPDKIHLALPQFNFNLASIWDAAKDGVAVFVIASLETLLSATTLDSLTSSKTTNMNQEFIGQGIANIITAICGGMPVTEVITRSRLNFNSNAKTKRSAIFQALLIFAIIEFYPQVINLIPEAVLIGILFGAALAMMNFKKLFKLWRHDHLEGLTYLITFIAIICTDLIRGIEIGFILSLVVVSMRLLVTEISIKFGNDNNILRIALSGNMSFWAFEKLNDLQTQIMQEPSIKFVVFEFANLHGMDGTGAKHLLDLASAINNNNIKVIFHGLNSKQQKTLNSIRGQDSLNLPYLITVTENDIKNILEKSGVVHHATDILKHGVTQFQQEYAANNQTLINKLASGQNPHTLLFTCSDSRLDPNAFFRANLGEIFVVRNVGNVIPTYNSNNEFSECAAIEFAIDVLNIRNIVICAHTECGAVKASIAHINSNTKTGLDNWLQLIKDGFLKQPPKDTLSGVKLNLLNQLEHLKTYPNIKALLEQNSLTISAWVYDVNNAQILEWNGSDFVLI